MIYTAYNSLYNHNILPEGHKFPMIKYDLLKLQLLHRGILEDDEFIDPEKETSDKDILRVHCKEYLNKLNTLALSKIEERRTGFPLSELLICREKTIMQGGIIATEAALQSGGISMNIAGGTHHAYRAHGEGFCLLNDIAISAAMLIDKHKLKKILVVDLDVHQGNGTAEIFENSAEVFTFSAHAKNNYPFKKEKSDFDLNFEDGTDDKSYLSQLKHALQDICIKTKPQFVFYQCGVDVLASDKLGKLSLSIDGCMERDNLVFDIFRNYNIPMHCCMGGGYSENIAHIIDAHSNTFISAKNYV